MAEDLPFGVTTDPLSLPGDFEILDVQRNRPVKTKRQLGRTGQFLGEKFYDPQTSLTCKYNKKVATAVHGITAHGQLVNNWIIDDWEDPEKNEDHQELTVKCHKNSVV